MPAITCARDESRLSLLRPCMANDYTLEVARPYTPFDPFADPDGFPLCCISKRTVVYSCGVIARNDDNVVHNHPAQEIQLCKRLAAKAAAAVEGLEVGMGSEGTPVIFDESGKTVWGTDGFSPFFVAAKTGDKVQKRLSDALIRRKFGDVIFPDCIVRVEALREKGAWWENVLQWYSGSEEDERISELAQWRKTIEWFAAQKAFVDTAFVMIGDGPEHGGAHFPRLAIGLTKAGSLAGIIGVVVHT